MRIYCLSQVFKLTYINSRIYLIHSTEIFMNYYLKFDLLSYYLKVKTVNKHMHSLHHPNFYFFHWQKCIIGQLKINDRFCYKNEFKSWQDWTIFCAKIILCTSWERCMNDETVKYQTFSGMSKQPKNRHLLSNCLKCELARRFFIKMLIKDKMKNFLRLCETFSV